MLYSLLFAPIWFPSRKWCWIWCKTLLYKIIVDDKIKVRLLILSIILLAAASLRHLYPLNIKLLARRSFCDKNKTLVGLFLWSNRSVETSFFFLNSNWFAFIVQKCAILVLTPVQEREKYFESTLAGKPTNAYSSPSFKCSPKHSKIFFFTLMFNKSISRTKVLITIHWN